VWGRPTQGIGQRANTRMNVRRYKASGMIQMKGMAAISVVRYVVTPSIKLTGAADKPTQGRRRPQVNARCGRAVLVSAGLVTSLAADCAVMVEIAFVLPSRRAAVMAVTGAGEGLAVITGNSAPARARTGIVALLGCFHTMMPQPATSATS